jgi:hypothetical protein
VVAVVLVTGSGNGAAVESDLDRAGDTIAIQQILVTHILDQRPSWHGYSPEAFCIALGRLEWKGDLLVPPTGPSDLFLSRVQTQGKPVLAARACEMVSLGVDAPGVVTIEARKPAFFITVSRVLYQSPSSAEAQAGFVCGSLCSWGVTFVLQKHDGKWQMVGRRNLVMS